MKISFMIEYGYPNWTPTTKSTALEASNTQEFGSFMQFWAKENH
jgi:hypothetical protein